MESGLTLRGGVMGGLKLMGSRGSIMYGGFLSGRLASCAPDRLRRTACLNLRYLVSFDGTDCERELDCASPLLDALSLLDTPNRCTGLSTRSTMTLGSMASSCFASEAAAKVERHANAIRISLTSVMLPSEW